MDKATNAATAMNAPAALLQPLGAPRSGPGGRGGRIGPAAGAGPEVVRPEPRAVAWSRALRAALAEVEGTARARKGRDPGEGPAGPEGTAPAEDEGGGEVEAIPALDSAPSDPAPPSLPGSQGAAGLALMVPIPAPSGAGRPCQTGLVPAEGPANPAAAVPILQGVEPPRPQTAALGAGHPAPAGDARTPALEGDAGPAVPVGDARSAVPVGDARSAAPAGDARPAVPAGDARPAVPAGDARPAVPAGDGAGTGGGAPGDAPGAVDRAAAAGRDGQASVEAAARPAAHAGASAGGAGRASGPEPGAAAVPPGAGPSARGTAAAEPAPPGRRAAPGTGPPEPAPGARGPGAPPPARDGQEVASGDGVKTPEAAARGVALEPGGRAAAPGDPQVTARAETVARGESPEAPEVALAAGASEAAAARPPAGSPEPGAAQVAAGARSPEAARAAVPDEAPPSEADTGRKARAVSAREAAQTQGRARWPGAVEAAVEGRPQRRADGAAPEAPPDAVRAAPAPDREGWATGGAVAMDPAAARDGAAELAAAGPAGPEPRGDARPAEAGEPPAQAAGLKDPQAQIQEVVRHARLVQRAGGETELRLRLEPEHLGQVDLRLVARGGRVEAEVLVSSQQARQAFEGDLPRLKEALASHGVTLAQCRVDVGGGGAAGNRPGQDPSVAWARPTWAGAGGGDPAPGARDDPVERRYARWLLPGSSFEYVA